MFEQAYNMNCPPYPGGRPNFECLCKDANFLNGIHDCVFATCNSTPDAETTLDLAAIYCTDPKYKSPDCPCLDPLLSPGASPAAAVAPAPEVNSNSNAGSDSSANNDDVSSPSGSTNPNPNSNSDDGTAPTGNNDNTLVATPTTANGNDVVASNSVETEGEGGGLKTVTAYVAPKATTELANTASASAPAGSASKTNELDHADASTPTSASSGGEAKNSIGAREMGSLWERVLLVVVLGFVMVL
ncbi:hypothetical protein B0T13DRAFT_305062 [Neurospora crassa]|nr:hypothetical protein B0T13DRAFT_305062 [Neurospora crassa]